MLISPPKIKYPPYPDGMPHWRQHFISVEQIRDRRDLDEVIFPRAKRLQYMANEEGASEALKGKGLALLFYEPSTRTSSSFVMAIQRLGGMVDKNNGMDYSSAAKGESFEDTIKTMAAYTDAIVIRSKQEGQAKKAAQISPVPIINAGDGKGEHPTQAVLDLLTIQRELKRIDGLTVTLVGDLKHGRTVHSLSRLLCLYDGIKLNLVSPKALSMPEPLLARLRGHGLQPYEHDRLDEVVSESDVIYMTRVQLERIPKEERPDQTPYVVTESTMAKAKPRDQMILMHPLPRDSENGTPEIAVEVDDDPRAAYFRQTEYGMYARMALLYLMLHGE
ncbi:MAG: aspartate carbamoyltransferase [Patescibacteria group bacterium]